jgi:hypothetical protein
VKSDNESGIVSWEFCEFLVQLVYTEVRNKVYLFMGDSKLIPFRGICHYDSLLPRGVSFHLL